MTGNPEGAGSGRLRGGAAYPKVAVYWRRLLWCLEQLESGESPVLSQQAWDPEASEVGFYLSRGPLLVQRLPHKRVRIIWTLPHTQVLTPALPAAFLSGC